MSIRDNHLHTHHSYDSDANFTDYLTHFDGEIVTTEHYDLSNPYTKQDDVPEYEAYSREIESLNRKYGNRIKRGIEIGYYQPRERDILDFLDGKDYDLKLLSVHHNGVNDYLDDEVADMDKAMSLMPGKKKINVHACYAIFEDGEFVDRDKLEPKHFQKWVDFAKERGMGLDFNPTFFSHPMVKDGLTLSSPDEEVRNFWIEHGKACIRISQYFAEQTGVPCVMNIWTGDGFKDIPADRMGPRVRYKESIDAILSEPFDTNLVKPCVESKVFGIGVEAYTVGSAEFSLSYAAMNKDKCLPLMDNGHYHPTEVVSDKIPALLAFFPEIALHITRPVRWDSDHVTIMDDPTMELFSEIVRCGALDRVHYGLDYFDASINRIGAYVIGSRAAQKCMTRALLEPIAKLREYEANGQGFQRLALLEEEKALPWNAVWDMFCLKNNVPVGEDFIAEIEKYEAEVTSKR